jgi:hypothetical protein
MPEAERSIYAFSKVLGVLSAQPCSLEAKCNAQFTSHQAKSNECLTELTGPLKAHGPHAFLRN